MIKVICVGKLKEKYLIDLVNDYYERIKKYHKIELIELKDSDIDKEAIEIGKYIKPGDFIVTLDIDGNKINSIELSKKIDDWLMNYGNITFIIGGSLGISDEIKKRSNFALSFSCLTFPHGLFRGVLLEQIYRSFKILNNETYHK
ncbi:MAG: 23S rRNA (pseudouridine(1915)-N(3))-methyltransferase RlmH [Bacilli bacterium]|nr:23S rRNA (pseudouridine(1915)-N(3))-methyltransferase RlmH [Bacilli bacterium]